MLPSMVSYNNSSSNSEDMEEDDLSALGAAELADDLSDSSFEFNPNELLSAPLLDNSDDELERTLENSSELNFDQMEGRQNGFAARSRAGFAREAPQQTMFLDSNGFPVEAPAAKVKSKRRPIPEDQRPRRIPGLVKQGSSKSNLLSRSSRASRSLQADVTNSGMNFNQGNFDTNMDVPMDNFSTNTTSNDNMDVNMNTSPHEMDVTMSNTEPETLQVPGNDLQSYNDAMEKLCESMKRSAMSRNLVKELSSRSLQKDGSSRSIGTHPSTSTSRQSSARSINVVSRNSSARSLGQQGSVRSLDGNGFGPLSPGAYPSQRHHRHASAMVDHRRTASGRGVFRHNSSGAVHNKKPRRNMNQYDDSALGLVFDGKNMYS